MSALQKALVAFVSALVSLLAALNIPVPETFANESVIVAVGAIIAAVTAWLSGKDKPKA